MWHDKDPRPCSKSRIEVQFLQLSPVMVTSHKCNIFMRSVQTTKHLNKFNQPVLINTYQLDHIKKDFFKRLLFLRISNNVCVFPTVCSLDFVRLFNFSMHAFGTGRPFILAICLITSSASRILLFETSHRKLSGKMLKVNEVILITIMNEMILIIIRNQIHGKNT